MRQTLFRIHTDSLFSFAPIDGVTAVGGIVLLLLWCAYGVYGLWTEHRAGRLHNGLPIGSIVLWLAVATALFTMPKWLGPRIPNGLPVFGYGVMVFCGFAAGSYTAMRRAKSAGLNPNLIWDLLTWFFLGGIGGARIFYLVQKRREVYAGVNDLAGAIKKTVNLTDGGLVLLGGVIGVVLVCLLFARKRKISTLLLADVLVPSFFLGLAFGRVGCLLNGCCFGDRCELPWAIHFPAESVPWSVLVHRGFLGPSAAMTYGLHPTQVYSAITALVLSMMTAVFFRYRPYDGAVLMLGMLLYAAKRMVVEFLRGDELGQFGTIFTISQWISAGIFVAGLLLWAALETKHRLPSRTRLVS